MNEKIRNVGLIFVTDNSVACIDNIRHAVQLFEKVIVVDNNSRDRTVSLLGKLEGVQVVALPDNLGYGKACNIGLRKIASEYALIMNPDSRIERDSIVELLRVAQVYPEFALMAPQSYLPSGAPEISYRQSYFQTVRDKDYIVPSGPASAYFLSGCCLLVNVAKYSDIGFDESFFLYFEDDDICLQNIKKGRDCIVVPSARIVHDTGRSSGSGFGIQFLKAREYSRSKKYFIGKYQGRGLRYAYISRGLFSNCIKIAFYLVVFDRKRLTKSVGAVIGLLG